MKIIIDATTTQDQFANRGIGRYTNEVVSRMIEYSSQQGMGDTFYLLLFKSPTTLTPVLKKYSEIIKTIDLGPLRISGFLNDLWWNLQIKPKIKRLIREEHPDVYFCPYFWRNFPVKKISTVVAIHDLAFPILNRYSLRPHIFDLIRKFQYHSTLNRVSKVAGVITDSENTKNDLLKYVKAVNRDKVFPIHLGISDEFHKIEVDEDVILKYLPKNVLDQGYIIYYGGVEVNKNVENIVRAYSMLVSNWKSKSNEENKSKLPYLVLAGGDFTKLDMRHKALAQVRYLIEELNLQEYVYFTGFFEDEDLNDLLSAAKLMVHISLYEGFGFAALEAMKCRVPVVASDKSFYQEVLGDGALLVDPQNPDLIAQAFSRVLSDEEVAKKLSELGGKKADSYTWDKTSQKTYDLFRSFVGLEN
ncbi:glycosyltransferase family 4 protein [Candidatus Dojkabacteria bacterium]|nr:glycosyltransferase family 4 protein [Candidatus Dojkabacteria bacterium]